MHADAKTHPNPNKMIIHLVDFVRMSDGAMRTRKASVPTKSKLPIHPWIVCLGYGDLTELSPEIAIKEQKPKCIES